MGTETARLQERLEAALGPGWDIGREVRLAPRLQHPHDVRTPTEVGTALGTPADVMPEQVTGDPAMDHCADLYALGAMGTDSSWGRIRSLAERPTPPSRHISPKRRRRFPNAGRRFRRRPPSSLCVLYRKMLQIGPKRRRGRSCTRFGRDAGASPGRPAAIVISTLVYGVRLCALRQPCPVASTLPATRVRRTLAPRNSGRSACEVVFPPPTGGRFK